MEDSPLNSALPLSAGEIERTILTALGHIMTEQYRWKVPRIDLASDPYRPEIPESLRNLHDRNFSNSFANVFLTVAVSLRVAQDRNMIDIDEICADAFEWIIRPNKPRSSLIRECSNRIIHAEIASFIIKPFTEQFGLEEDAFADRDRGSGGAIWLELSGKEHNKPWKCRLDVLEFLDAAARSAMRLRLREQSEQTKLMQLSLGRHSMNEGDA
jgi:hypothetical protein